jgi:hypothetical protein
MAGAALLIAGVAVACGSGDDDDEGSEVLVSTTSLSQNADGSAVDAPVSRFAILLEDLGAANYVTDLNYTWNLTADMYAGTEAFASKDAGLDQLGEWGYREGFETAIVPERGTEALFSGGYVLHQELHLFESADGASQAFAYFTEKVRTNGVSKTVDFAALGDESFGTRTTSGMVGGTSSVEQVLHQVIFRRANVVAVVLTIGAGPLMDIEIARELGVIVDEKIRGLRDDPEPTPIPARTVDGDGQARR